jgi:hypothetical protein
MQPWPTAPKTERHAESVSSLLSFGSHNVEAGKGEYVPEDEVGIVGERPHTIDLQGRLQSNLKQGHEEESLRDLPQPPDPSVKEPERTDDCKDVAVCRDLMHVCK